MERRTEAKSQYIRVFTKLKKQTEKNQKATISKSIRQVKDAWKDLEEAHSNYAKEASSAENLKLVQERGDMESDMEEIIANASMLSIGREEETWSSAELKYKEASNKLNKMVEKEEKTNISQTIKEVKANWRNFETAHTKLRQELTGSGKEEEASQFDNKFGDLESDMEEMMDKAEELASREEEVFKECLAEQLSTDEVGSGADGNETGGAESREEAETPEDKGEKNKKPGFMSKTKSLLKSVAENVQHTVQNTLGKVVVSKDQYDRFQVALKDQLVDQWEETSASKVFQGVQIEKYPEFLELFRTATGIDDKVFAEFKAMEFTDRMDDKVKSFTCEGSATGGKYGVYMAIKRPQEDKIDVAYAMYDYKAKFTGNSTASPNKYNIWNTEKDKTTGLYRLTTPVVENILTGKLMNPNRNFTVGDMNELTENFIVAKALQAFAHYGVISKVTWAEDVPKIDQQSKPQIEEVP